MSAGIIVTGDSILKLSRGVKMREDKVRERTVLLAPERTLGLDESGIAILGRMDGKNSVEEIAEHLADVYKAPKDVVEKDAMTFLQDLADRRFLELVS